MEKLLKITYANAIIPLENRDKINELIDRNEKLEQALFYLGQFYGKDIYEKGLIAEALNEILK